MTCNEARYVNVTANDVTQYLKDDKLVQDVWPQLNAWDRDIIIGFRTGVFQCQDCSDYDPIDDIIKESETTGEY
jgi:hypothetical protein